MTTILIVASVLAGGVLIYARNARASLIVLLIVTALLSGSENETVNFVGIQVRRLCIVFLALLVLRNKSRLPKSVVCLIGASLVGISGLLQADAPESGPTLLASTFLLHLPAAITIRSWVVEPGNKEKIGRIFIFAASIHGLLTAVYLRDFTGETRFAGAGSNAPLFAFAGGALLSALLWGLFYEKGQTKLVCIPLLPITILLTLLGAQRSGLLSLGAAVIPFLALGLIRYPMKMLKIVSGSIVTVWLVVSNSTLFDFAFERFSTLDSNGRDERWNSAWELIRQRPVSGWGPGSREEVGFGVHNSFVSIWLELGIVGLILWVAAIVIALNSCLKVLSRYKSDGEGVALLSLSWLSVCVAFAQVEDKLYRPSNLPAVVFLLALLTASVVADHRNVALGRHLSRVGGAWSSRHRNWALPVGQFRQEAKQ